MSKVRAVEPFTKPVHARVVVPGSKSYTNRALVAAALANGASTLTGALRSDDTEAMAGCLRSLGLDLDVSGTTFEVHGRGPSFPNREAVLTARQSGTTARFVLPMLGLGTGRYELGAAPQMLRRPMADQIEALRHLGMQITETEREGYLPVVVEAAGFAGGRVEVPGDVSSQFLSGMLLAGPLMGSGLDIAVTTALVSRSYVDLTIDVMRSFGAEVVEPDGRAANRFVVSPGSYRPIAYAVEPDASAASYFLGLAAVTGGQVTIPGLGRQSQQGDLAFAELLGRMGCAVTMTAESVTVVGPSDGQLSGIEADMTDCSDVAQTLAAVAVFASGPTEVTGIGFIRHKETDRIAAVVTELRRAGIEADETSDGFIVRPGMPKPTTIATYDDHRMAMSFALLGTRAPGISIADPGCVAKTFPSYFETLDSLR